jgi:alpha 1,3-glucosidase
MYYEDRPESFVVDPSTIELKKNKISFVLKTSIFNENLKDILAKLYILKNGMFRIKIRDLEKKRFHFKKADETFNMKGTAKLKNFKYVNSTLTKFSVYYFDKTKKNQYFIDIDSNKKIKYELVVQYNPFEVFYSIDNKEILKINSKNLLNMEFPTDSYVKTEEEAMSSVKLDVTYSDCLLLWGLPERGADSLLSDTKDDDPYRLFNVDKFKFTKDQSFGLYGSWPFIIGYQQGGEIYSGFIWNNPSETYVGIQSLEGIKNVLWLSEKGLIDFTFFSDYNINNFYYKYHRYIGFAPLPPSFALGYHQSRWNYQSTKDVINVDKLFDENDIPYDTIWLDIEHTDEKRYMTWNQNFEGIEDFIETLDDKNRNLVVIIDPHIKVDNRYNVYNQAYDNGKLKFFEYILNLNRIFY